MIESNSQVELKTLKNDIIFPILAAFSIFIFTYFILTKRNENHRFVIESYETELSKYQATRDRIDDLIKLRREFIQLDMYLEESFTLSERFLKILDASLTHFPSSANFANIMLENGSSNIKLIVEDKKYIDDYCRKVNQESFSCEYSTKKENRYEVEVSLNEPVL